MLHNLHIPHALLRRPQMKDLTGGIRECGLLQANHLLTPLAFPT